MPHSTQNTLSPLIQLVLLISITLGLMGAGMVAAIILIILVYGFETLKTMGDMGSLPAGALWIIQIISGTIPLFAAPVIFASAVVKNPAEYLKTNKNISIALFAVVFAIMFACSPTIELLANLNEKILSLEFLNGFAAWSRDKENAARETMEMFLRMDNIGQMLFNLLVVGLLTAIAEEFLFRGGLQTIFYKWTGNIHAAVWITAIIFSAFHVQFFGFLPRLLLGLLFGYVVAWSGSIWPGVWAHFVNNGTAVVVTYLYQHKKTNLNPDNQHVFNYTAYIVSIIFVLFLLAVYKRLAPATKNIPAQ